MIYLSLQNTYVKKQFIVSNIKTNNAFIDVIYQKLVLFSKNMEMDKSN